MYDIFFIEFLILKKNL